jgi:putative glutamate/gamma-aminobutyrate antiporter
MSSNEKTSRPVSVFMLAMINVAAILSIKNWPLTAEYGFSSLFFFLISVVVFFIPISLVAAELATAWPERGGVFVWVKKALGHRFGFLAIWLLWVENVIWYPTILSFVAGTIAFAFNPALAENTLYLFITVFGTFWVTTFINLRGMRISGWISTFGVIFGTIVPGIIIIGLGLLWLTSGKPLQIEFTIQSLVPNLSSPTQMAFLAGVLLSFAGMEMSAVHAKDVVNPKKNYPRAILLSSIIIVVLSVLGTLAIAFVIPQEKISLIAGGMDAISYFLKTYNLGWSIPIISILIAIGALGSVSTWIVGPSKGLLAAAQEGDLPAIMHKMNKQKMPVALLITQAIIVSALSFVFLFMPDVSSSFWILLALTSQLYLLLYVLIFISAIILRYRYPSTHRPYTVPGGKMGMWLISGLGIVGSFYAMVVGFFPPDQLETGNLIFYESFLTIGMIVFCAAPFVILWFKKPEWKH